MNFTLNDSKVVFNLSDDLTNINLSSDVIDYKLNTVTGGAEPDPVIEYLTDESDVTITSEAGVELTPE